MNDIQKKRREIEKRKRHLQNHYYDLMRQSPEYQQLMKENQQNQLQCKRIGHVGVAGELNYFGDVCYYTCVNCGFRYSEEI